MSRAEDGSESAIQCVLYSTVIKPPRVTNESSSVIGRRPLLASSWVSERGGTLLRRHMCDWQHNKKSSGRAGGRPIVMQRTTAWHVRSTWCSSFQSACETRATESANCSSSTLSRASNCVDAVGLSPRVGGNRNIGVPIGSARSRTDGNGTVGTGEAVGAGVAAVDGVCRGRGIYGGC